MSRRRELDLIARDGDVLVFVEVKSRRAGEPAEAVTPEKQRRLTAAALEFQKRYHVLEVPSRFDVVTVVWPAGSRRPEITHYRNAFEARGGSSMYG